MQLREHYDYREPGAMTGRQTDAWSYVACADGTPAPRWRV